MIICDEYLALAALSNNPPLRTSEEQIATTPAAWTRALRSRHNVDNPQQLVEGQLSQIIRRLSPTDQAQLSSPDPRLLEILDPWPFLDISARLAVAYPLSYMASEMAAAAIFHQAPLHFFHEGNVPPGIHVLLKSETFPGIRIISPA